jgi:glycine/D-amino acid oxidase-like deaminating enzyme
MAAAVQAGGGAVHEHTPVAAVSGDGPLEVRAGSHRLTADRVVLATHTPLQGAAGSFGTLLSQLRIAMYTSYAVRARVDKGQVPDALWWDTVDPYRYVRLDPGEAHDYVIVGGGDHKTGQQVDAATRYAELEGVVRQIAPGAAVDYRWSGQIVEPSDGLPFIGQSARCQFSATGYAGNGMTFGTIAGMMAADWAADITSPFADVFSWQRTGLGGGGFGAVLGENVDFPMHRVHEALTRPAADGASVPIGTGRIMDIGGAAAAVYRRQDETLVRPGRAAAGRARRQPRPRPPPPSARSFR